MYYLQSRYYNPGWGRFINADAPVSTGQGILGKNMFAYCRNNPVIKSDAAGAVDYDCFSNDVDDENLLRTSSSGADFWNSLMSSMQSATEGLNMAMGQRNVKDIAYHGKPSVSWDMFPDENSDTCTDKYLWSVL